jgi:hypothetical protein
MDGINWPNFQGLEQQLKQRPANADTWRIVRGQALLIAENGNLLMLRPPRNEGAETWLYRATALRTDATRLARAAAAQDYERSRSELMTLAQTCNRCHQSFRIEIRIRAFADEAGGPPVPATPAVPPPAVPKASPPPKPPSVPD